jgi:hypothetical protein
MRNLIALPLVCVALLSLPAYSQDTLSQAKQIVADYQALREACAETRGKKRLDCMRRLSDASDAYREAKNLVIASENKAQIKLAKGH